MGHVSLGLYSAFDALVRLTIACDELRKSIGIYLPDDVIPTREYASRRRTRLLENVTAARLSSWCVLLRPPGGDSRRSRQRRRAPIWRIGYRVMVVVVCCIVVTGTGGG
jgi:hypothetical protein